MEELEIVKSFLSSPKTVAVIGASNKETRAGHFVPKFLMQKGFEIIPINPNYDSVLGKKCYNSYLELADQQFDAVIIYRNTKDAIQMAKLVIDLKNADLIWFPDFVTSKEIRKLTKINNIKFVEDRCPLRDYRRYVKQ